MHQSDLIQKVHSILTHSVINNFAKVFLSVSKFIILSSNLSVCFKFNTHVHRLLVPQGSVLTVFLKNFLSLFSAGGKMHFYALLCTSLHFFALPCTPNWECILPMHSQLGVHNFFHFYALPEPIFKNLF